MEPSSPTPQKNEPVGPMVGIVVIVLLLVAGGIYFLLMEQQERAEQAAEAQASNF